MTTRYYIPSVSAFFMLVLPGGQRQRRFPGGRAHRRAASRDKPVWRDGRDLALPSFGEEADPGVANRGLFNGKLDSHEISNKELPVFVAATSRCFPDLPLSALATPGRFGIQPRGNDDPRDGRANQALGSSGQSRPRRDALPPNTPPDSGGLQRRTGNARQGLYYRQFAASCRLAKATKVVT